MKDVEKSLAEIRQLLDSVEDHLIWLIKPETRFRVGQRVEFSRRARKRGFPKRKELDAGKVTEIDGFTVYVRLDGYKTEHGYHHAFFNPINGPKLF